MEAEARWLGTRSLVFVRLSYLDFWCSRMLLFDGSLCICATWSNTKTNRILATSNDDSFGLCVCQ